MAFFTIKQSTLVGITEASPDNKTKSPYPFVIHLVNERIFHWIKKRRIPGSGAILSAVTATRPSEPLFRLRSHLHRP
jgi:hypothetical protein